MDLFSSPQEAIIRIFSILLALTVHEASHAYVADRLGDPTPRAAGRLTLNPLAHLDPIGTLVFIFARFGWAKPVPVDSRYFKNPRRDDLLVSIAGPCSNVALALLMAFLYHALLGASSYIGSSQMGASGLEFFVWVAYTSVWINIVLALFNLIPIPPLDGSWVLAAVLPPRLAAKYKEFSRYGMVLLLLLVFSGAFGKILFPMVNFFAGILLGR